MRDEPKLTGLLIVGRTRFNPKVSLSSAQGAIDRLFTRYQKADAALSAVREFNHRLPPDVASMVEAALRIEPE